MPKYSIIVPAYNGMPYLKTCIESIISQNYDDYELVLSEDHSSDGTAEYIDSLTDGHIIRLHCPERTSMAEHWEWALSHASGLWQMFVGQDDALQSFFFELADKLVSICDKKDLEVIMSERAYFFWPGCEDSFGDTKINFFVKKKKEIADTSREMFRALYKNPVSYMNLPSMYTTSLFKRSFIDHIRKIQDGKVFSTHPQDANLAALACIFQKKYLKSYIPLGWVGSSPKSAGLAISNFGTDLSVEYLRVTKLSNLKQHPLAGSFEFSSFPVYFWGALLSISEKFNPKLYKKLTDKGCRIKVLSLAQYDVNESNRNLFEDLLSINKIAARDLYPMKKNELCILFDKLIEKIKSPQKHWEFLLKQNDNSDDLLKISNYLASEIRKRRYL